MKTFLFVGDEVACEVSDEEIGISWGGIVPKLGDFIYPPFPENFGQYILISAETYKQASVIWDYASNEYLMQLI